MQLKWQFSLWCLLAKISFKDFSPCCKMWKYEKTTNNWVFCIFTQSSQLLQICSENCPKSYLIQNINRSNGKHGGYFHFRQWRGGEVLILHFYLSSFLHLQNPPNVCSLTNPHKSALQNFQWSKLAFPRPAWIHQWSETFFKSNKLVENLKDP